MEKLKEMKVETNLGTIIVKESSDNHYPGVFVDFKPIGLLVERPVVSVECNLNEDNEDGGIRIISYEQKGIQNEDIGATRIVNIFDNKDVENMKVVYKECMEECAKKLDEEGIEYDKYQFSDFAFGYYTDVISGESKEDAMKRCLEAVFGL